MIKKLSLLICALLLFTILFCIQPATIPVARAQEENIFFYLPLIVLQRPPTAPIIYGIQNQDFDTVYSVTWSAGEDCEYFTLEESTFADFHITQQVYGGASHSWDENTGKYPGTYYYRVKCDNDYAVSAWSSPQYITINPLFMGLKVRWDGNGYIRGTLYYDVGDHNTVEFDQLTDADTLQASSHQWYSPNPGNWDPSSWLSYYSISTGQFKSSNSIGDPAWKWSDPWKLDYTATYKNGQIVKINGQSFKVTGPISGYTSFGTAIQYWQFVNTAKFLFWDGGGDWKQYVHPGDVVLRYDAGGSKLELYSSILRREYYRGALKPDTVQYIAQLTSASSLPGSPSFSSTSINSVSTNAASLADQNNRGTVENHAKR